MLMVLPIAPMRVEHRDVAPLERLAPDGAIEIVQALRPAAHERTQHDRGVLVEGRAEHRWHRQDDMPIDDPFVEDLAHLADPVVDVRLWRSASTSDDLQLIATTCFPCPQCRQRYSIYPIFVGVATGEHLAPPDHRSRRV